MAMRLCPFRIRMRAGLDGAGAGIQLAEAY